MMQREMHKLESIETVCNEVGTYIKQSTTFKEQIHEQQITTIGSTLMLDLILSTKCCKHVVYFPIHLEHILGHYCCQTFSMEHPKN